MTGGTAKPWRDGNRDGLLEWGSDQGSSPSTGGRGFLQAAKWESGMDDSPMYDEASYDPQAYTMNLDRCRPEFAVCSGRGVPWQRLRRSSAKTMTPRNSPRNTSTAATHPQKLWNETGRHLREPLLEWRVLSACRPQISTLCLPALRRPSKPSE